MMSKRDKALLDLDRGYLLIEGAVKVLGGTLTTRAGDVELSTIIEYIQPASEPFDSTPVTNEKLTGLWLLGSKENANTNHTVDETMAHLTSFSVDQAIKTVVFESLGHAIDTCIEAVAGTTHDDIRISYHNSSERTVTLYVASLKSEPLADDIIPCVAIDLYVNPYLPDLHYGHCYHVGIIEPRFVHQ